MLQYLPIVPTFVSVPKYVLYVSMLLPASMFISVCMVSVRVSGFYVYPLLLLLYMFISVSMGSVCIFGSYLCLYSNLCLCSYLCVVPISVYYHVCIVSLCLCLYLCLWVLCVSMFPSVPMILSLCMFLPVSMSNLLLCSCLCLSFYLCLCSICIYSFCLCLCVYLCVCSCLCLCYCVYVSICIYGSFPHLCSHLYLWFLSGSMVPIYVYASIHTYVPIHADRNVDIDRTNRHR